MEVFFSFKSLNNRKKVTESFFQLLRYIATLSSHMMQKFPETIFSLSLVTSHGYNNILISMKKDAGHISVNTVRATFLLHK